MVNLESMAYMHLVNGAPARLEWQLAGEVMDALAEHAPVHGATRCACGYGTGAYHDAHLLEVIAGLIEAGLE